MDLREYGFDKPFALDRGELVLKALQHDFAKEVPYVLPAPISIGDAELVHSKAYLGSLKHDETWRSIFELKPEELLPPGKYKPLHCLLDDILLKCGGTYLAAKSALEDRLSANLGGGYHHAFPNEGRGFCVINDIAVAIRKLQKDHLLKKVMIVDLDFHQGDGSALVFQNDPDVFTLSVHSEEGWPDEKQKSDLDISIRSNETHLYLQKTREAVDLALSRIKPDLCIFVAGSDPYELDTLPGTRFIKLSLETLQARDAFVIDKFFDLGIPLAMVFAGGYGPDVWRVHYQAAKHLLIRAGTMGNTVCFEADK